LFGNPGKVKGFVFFVDFFSCVELGDLRDQEIGESSFLEESWEVVIDYIACVV
jgi:hypothetical protein